MSSTIWKYATALAVVSALAATAATPSFARGRGGAIAAGLAAGAIFGAAAVAAGAYDGPYDYYDAPPVYVGPDAVYGAPAPYYWGNTNSLGPNRARMEHSN
jgi:hypothetical protein